MRRGHLLAILAIGIGLVAAPAVFQMFTRAPAGGRMIDDFRPFMTEQRLGAFSDHLDTIDGAHAATTDLVRDHDLGPDELDERFGAVATFVEEWPGIQDEMGGMLADIQENVDNFEAVDALPPFALFPWFFVLPGLLLIGLAGSALYTGGSAPVRRRLLVVLGVGLVAAPAVFGMFTRAPKGAEMIEAFRPIMTESRVTGMQSDFLVLAGAEGGLRTDVAPFLAEEGTSLAEDYPDIEVFVERWPRISADMAPMVGAMSDNLEAFRGIAALPPFWLFPWFFVLPGVLVAGLAFAAGRGSPPRESQPNDRKEALDVPT